VERFARDAARFAAVTGKPIAVAAWQEPIAKVLRAAGLATYATESEALRVFSQLASHTALMRKPRREWPAETTVEWPPATHRFLNEAESLRLLERSGLPVVRHRLCRSAAETRAAFGELGRRVAIKACSVDVPHKSEHGLVALDVADEDEAARLFEAHWAMLAELEVSREGVIVAAMGKGRHELMVGARIDPVFGPVVVVGAGGKYVEALDDIALLVPPFDASDVSDALHRLHIARLFAGVRGEPPLDCEALVAIVIGVGRLILAGRRQIASIDLNPVLVGSAGEGAIIVDALIEISSRCA
jgi:acyl-CoA synthetase (NDP forming)